MKYQLIPSVHRPTNCSIIHEFFIYKDGISIKYVDIPSEEKQVILDSVLKIYDGVCAFISSTHNGNAILELAWKK